MNTVLAATNFIPSWSISVLFALLVFTLLGYALIAGGDRDITITDVPCQSCQRGYGEQHECEEPDYCACDQEVKHTNGPDLCHHNIAADVCLRCWIGED